MAPRAKRLTAADIERQMRDERPSDIVATFSLVDSREATAGEDVESGAGCELTREMLDIFQLAAERGLHGVGLHGVLQRCLEDSARQLREAMR